MTINKFSLMGLLLFCSTLFLTAQVDAKYLAGAVPLVDGKVVFTREIKVSPEVSANQLFHLVNEWAANEFDENENQDENDSKQRILLSNEDQNYLVAQGDEKLVFKSMILMLDQTTITYQLVVKAEQGKCTMEMRYIKYEYEDYKDLVTAEKMITDKVAINKAGDKLNRHYGKFRTFTIDKMDELRDSLIAYLGQTSLEEVKKAPASIVDVDELPQPAPSIKVEGSPAVSIAAPVAVAQTGQSMAGYKQMDADDISESITNMFKDNWVLVVSGEGKKAKVLPAAWSGMGSFGGKSVAMSIVKSAGNQDEVYTISFYTQIHKDALDKIENGKEHNLTPIITPSGAEAFAEAWMIIECKKVLEQPATDSMIKDVQSKEWNNKKFDKLIMGEIISVWAR